MLGKYIFLFVLVSLAWVGAFAKLGGLKRQPTKTTHKERRRLQPSDLNSAAAADDANEDNPFLPLCWGDCDSDEEVSFLSSIFILLICVTLQLTMFTN